MKIIKNGTIILIIGVIGLIAVIGVLLYLQYTYEQPARSYTPEEIAEIKPDPININTASLEELSTLPGLTEKQAQSIIEYREENGDFGETDGAEEIEENAAGDDDAEYRNIRAGMELGTEATRTPIITKAIHYGYIYRNGDSYLIEEKGKKMLSLLKRLQVDISLETSVSMQMYLKMVFNGTMDVDDVLAITQKKIRKDFEAGNPDRKWHP